MASLDSQDALGSTMEDFRGDFLNMKLNADAGENLLVQPTISMSRAAILRSKNGDNRKFTNLLGSGNNTDLRQGQNLIDDKSHLLHGTHCEKGRRTGNKCCSGAMLQVMDEVINELRTSPEFGISKKTPGVTANVVFAQNN